MSTRSESRGWWHELAAAHDDQGMAADDDSS